MMNEIQANHDHGLWQADRPVILASQSETRKLLLGNAGIPAISEPSRIDERELDARLKMTGAPASEIAIFLANAKAQSVARRFPNDLVIGADQTLSIDNQVFSKPSGYHDAVEQLLALSGRTHRLFSAVCVYRGTDQKFQALRNAELRMRSFGREFAHRYLDVAGPALLESIGVYQVENFGCQLFEDINGEQSTILGMPMLALIRWLQRKRLVAS